MNETSTRDVQGDAQDVDHFYQRAAQELLLACQSNQEATQHHASGAIRAALHHARLSLSHSWAAHACLSQILEISSSLSASKQNGHQAILGSKVHKGH